MSSFSQNLLARHNGQGLLVQPRTRGLFEPSTFPSQNFDPGLSRESIPADERLIAERPVHHTVHPGQDQGWEKKSENHQGRHPLENTGRTESNQSPGRPLPPYPASLPRAEKNNDGWPEPYTHRKLVDNRPFEREKPVIPKPYEEDSGTQDRVKPRKENGNADRERINQVEPAMKRFSPEPLLQYLSRTDRSWLREVRSAAEAYLQQNTAPVIKVSIGRIEVRASVQAPAQTPVRNSPPPRPRLTLEDYLNKQNGKP